MSKTISAVPESISREQYLGLMGSVGFEPRDLISLEFRPDGIYAVVPATDDSGDVIRDTHGEGEFAYATHTIYIPVTDGVHA